MQPLYFRSDATADRSALTHRRDAQDLFYGGFTPQHALRARLAQGPHSLGRGGATHRGGIDTAHNGVFHRGTVEQYFVNSTTPDESGLATGTAAHRRENLLGDRPGVTHQ